MTPSGCGARSAMKTPIWMMNLCGKFSNEDMHQESAVLRISFTLFDCVEVLRPCQQLRSCPAGQLPINVVPLDLSGYLASTPLVVTDNYRWVKFFARIT